MSICRRPRQGQGVDHRESRRSCAAQLKSGDEFAHRLRVPENKGRISFLRLDREINYNNVPRIFPRGVEDSDRYIGIEVSFTPELDVMNDNYTSRPATTRFPVSI